MVFITAPQMDKRIVLEITLVWTVPHVKLVGKGRNVISVQTTTIRLTSAPNSVSLFLTHIAAHQREKSCVWVIALG